jgi:hypothetical protein
MTVVSLLAYEGQGGGNIFIPPAKVTDDDVANTGIKTRFNKDQISSIALHFKISQLFTRKIFIQHNYNNMILNFSVVFTLRGIRGIRFLNTTNSFSNHI